MDKKERRPGTTGYSRQRSGGDPRGHPSRSRSEGSSDPPGARSALACGDLLARHVVPEGQLRVGNGPSLPPGPDFLYSISAYCRVSSELQATPDKWCSRLLKMTAGLPANQSLNAT